jgi:hypothetical protein
MPEISLPPFGKRYPDPPVTRDDPSHRDSFHAQNSKQELDRRLDQALEETFPASDPVSVVICL